MQFDLDNDRQRQLEVAGFSYTRALSLARPKNITRGRLARAFDDFLLQHDEAAEGRPID